MDQPAGRARAMEVHRMGYVWGTTERRPGEETKMTNTNAALAARMQYIRNSIITPFGRGACFDWASL